MTNVDTVEVLSPGTSITPATTLVVDLRGGPLAPGFTDEPGASDDPGRRGPDRVNAEGGGDTGDEAFLPLTIEGGDRCTATPVTTRSAAARP